MNIVKVIRITALLSLISNTLNLVILLYTYQSEQISIEGLTVTRQPTYTDLQIRILIEMALVISFIALWIEKKHWRLISTINLVIVLIAFVYWLKWTYEFINGTGAKYQMIKHLFFLQNANWFDICTLVSTIFLILLLNISNLKLHKV